jgi:hypothetical protein
MTTIVKMLHDKSSQLMDMLVHSLSEGKLCVIDLSQMRGGQSLVLSGLILRRIFDRNQQEFTSADPKTIPTIAVVEEAQSVLNENSTSSEPYVAWVKEGRKYDLGALLITQQPGSIPVEILSQGDNWFVFHLLSAADLGSLKKANAHFSDDLLSSLLNEPIPGQGVFWSSVGGKPYPVSLRALSFEKAFSVLDREYDRPAANTYARILRDSFQATVGGDTPGRATGAPASGAPVPTDEGADTDAVDVMARMEASAIEALRTNERLIGRIESDQGAAWGEILAFLMTHLPENIDNRKQFAYHLTPKALNQIFGPQRTAWEAYKNEAKKTTYVRKVR